MTEGQVSVWQKADDPQIRLHIFCKQRNLELKFTRDASDQVAQTLKRAAIKLKTDGSDIRLEDSQQQPLPDSATNAEAFRQGNTLIIQDIKFRIHVNVPVISSIVLHSYPMVGFPLLPCVELEFCTLETCEWRWFRTPRDKLCTDPESKLVSEEMCYTPQEGDVDFTLVCVCTPKNSAGVSGEAMSTTCPETPQQKREHTAKHGKSKIKYVTTSDETGVNLAGAAVTRCAENEFITAVAKMAQQRDAALAAAVSASSASSASAASASSPQKQLRLMTYNILLDAFCDGDWALENLYPYLNKAFAHRDYRQQLVLRDIMAYNPDVVCMQEVGGPMFDKYFQPHLSRLGYTCFYLNKISVQPFGSTICVRNASCRVIELVPLDLTTGWKQMPCAADIMAQENMEYKLSRTTTTAQLAYLRVLRGGGDGESEIASSSDAAAASADQQHKQQTVCIANVHFFSNPHAPNVRILQAANVIFEIEKRFPNTPLLLCGDFNARSDAGLHEFLLDRRIDKHHVEWLEGYLFNDKHTESQDERESSWHRSLNWVDITNIRATFCIFDRNKTGRIAKADVVALYGGPDMTERMKFHLLPEDQITYREFFFWYGRAKKLVEDADLPVLAAAMHKLVDKEKEKEMEDMMSSLPTQTSTSSENYPRKEMPLLVDDDTVVYARANLEHSLHLEREFHGARCTYFAGIDPSPDVVDFMYSSRDTVKCDFQFPLAPQELLSKFTAIPSVLFPSDHVPLVADFSFL